MRPAWRRTVAYSLAVGTDAGIRSLESVGARVRPRSAARALSSPYSGVVGSAAASVILRMTGTNSTGVPARRPRWCRWPAGSGRRRRGPGEVPDRAVRRRRSAHPDRPPEQEAVTGIRAAARRAWPRPRARRGCAPVCGPSRRRSPRTLARPCRRSHSAGRTKPGLRCALSDAELPGSRGDGS